jgi:hypothetical protein
MGAIFSKCWITRSAATGGRSPSVDHVNEGWPFEHAEGRE